MSFSRNCLLAAALALPLLAQNAPGQTAYDDPSLLIDAVKAGDVEQVARWARVSGQVNLAEPDGTTALHWAVRGAVRADDLTIPTMLLDAGADANAINRYHVTPLELAMVNANAPMVEMLLEAGAKTDLALPDGITLLMKAARTGNPEIVQKIAAAGSSAGVDINAREAVRGETALMWAAAENHAEAIEVLLEHGAQVNVRSTELQYPNDRFGLEGVTTILPHGSWTPLMYAARNGSREAAAALVKAGAEVDATDPDGTTALVLAIINGHFDTAAELVRLGADPNIGDSTGMAALYAAADMNTLGEIYGRPRRKITAETTALELMELLLEHGADPNGALERPTLHRAHTPGEGSLAEGTTPLMRAARNGDSAAIRLLVEHGADPEATQANGTTALMLAAGIGRGLGVFAEDFATDAQLLDAVQVLIGMGVDINAADAKGQTALHVAAQASDDIVRYLVEQGADLQAKDSQDRTPLDIAKGVGVRTSIKGVEGLRESTVQLLRELMQAQGLPIPE